MLDNVAVIVQDAADAAVVQNCVGAYEQCGGNNWNGATCCATGCTCKAFGDFYSQCRPPPGLATCAPLPVVTPAAPSAPSLPDLTASAPAPALPDLMLKDAEPQEGGDVRYTNAAAEKERPSPRG